MLGKEIDLLKNYPKSKRDTKGRANVITEADREIARQYGKDFFDGDRTYGYGGFHYLPRFWQPVVPDLQAHFGLIPQSSLLDVGCAKGFMLYDLQQHIPGINLKGLDVSEYALEHAKDEVKTLLELGDAKSLPFDDNSFDVVMSINTIHNLEEQECALALKEIERVSRGKSFITVDAYRDDAEKERMLEWALTAKTIMHVDDWKQFFLDNGYTGDFYWFIP
ncbi:methyltransferase type 11 [Pseudoalteromonas citrea]|uniref:Methyltransferase type 11 n=1 Tax=Pseudoalteromonas citrea TaxID=43655 RepID=A0A5S3XTV5_9GAMM|nr:class I SAM-dependent methyltransferase [Pseudoalteromonas citrea]TMP43483.1 methyltransferase type 11 [Pseudoalteromonas citrea]TMP62118.1 methyltransferase type 11 [Pseudoalteromonas citrea]